MRECVKTLVGHNSEVSSVIEILYTKFIASGSWDRTIKIWNYESGECISTLSGHKDKVCTLVYVPEKKFIVSGCDDKTIKIWNY